MAKKYMVVKATPEDKKAVEVDGKEMRYGHKSNAFIVNDPGVAREIQARNPKFVGDAVVVPIDPGPEPGHRRTFSVPELPWKRKQTNEPNN